MRCGSCGKKLLNYPMVPGVIYEGGTLSCSRCLSTMRALSGFAGAYSGAETFGNHRDEWEDFQNVATGGVGWMRTE